MSIATACMGGWCALRDRCPHYHADRRRYPAERLCEPGRDGHSEIAWLSTPAPPVGAALLSATPTSAAARWA